MSDCGTAEPPTNMRVMVEMSYWPGLASSSCSTPNQIVGTPAVVATRSRCNRSRRVGGSRFRAGVALFAPPLTPPHGSPQRFARDHLTRHVSTHDVDKP